MLTKDKNELFERIRDKFPHDMTFDQLAEIMWFCYSDGPLKTLDRTKVRLDVDQLVAVIFYVQETSVNGYYLGLDWEGKFFDIHVPWKESEYLSTSAEEIVAVEREKQISDIILRNF